MQPGSSAGCQEAAARGFGNLVRTGPAPLWHLLCTPCRRRAPVVLEPASKQAVACCQLLCPLVGWLTSFVSVCHGPAGVRQPVRHAASCGIPSGAASGRHRGGCGRGCGRGRQRRGRRCEWHACCRRGGLAVQQRRRAAGGSPGPLQPGVLRHHHAGAAVARMQARCCVRRASMPCPPPYPGPPASSPPPLAISKTPACPVRPAFAPPRHSAASAARLPVAPGGSGQVGCGGCAGGAVPLAQRGPARVCCGGIVGPGLRLYPGAGGRRARGCGARRRRCRPPPPTERRWILSCAPAARQPRNSPRGKGRAVPAGVSCPCRCGCLQAAACKRPLTATLNFLDLPLLAAWLPALQAQCPGCRSCCCSGAREPRRRRLPAWLSSRR